MEVERKTAFQIQVGDDGRQFGHTGIYKEIKTSANSLYFHARLKRKRSRVQPKEFLVVLKFRAEQVFVKAESRREKWERFLEGTGWRDCFKILFNNGSKIICWLRCANISEKAQRS